MPRKLKVYCTPIGFHDAYVAAASQKEALVAWGSDANLFARGMAEIVTDPALTSEPLAHPGTVIKRLRGTTEQHLDALPKSTGARTGRQKATDPSAGGDSAQQRERAPKPKLKPKPKPKRAKVDAAEEALSAAEREHRKVEEALRRREEALHRERRAIEEKQAAEIATLQRAVDRARDAYERALQKWRAERGCGAKWRL